jgi:serine/threonine protein kinase
VIAARRLDHAACPACGASALVEEPEADLPTDAGPLRLERPLHVGATHEIVAARLDGRAVVVKRVRRELLGGQGVEAALARLEHERERLREVQGPGVVALLASIDAEPSYVMPRYGRSLASLQPADLDPFGGVVGLGAVLGVALDRLHRLGVVHRDVHPGNVLVDPAEPGFEPLVLADFGHAWHPSRPPVTPERRVSLTPGYAAPETTRKVCPTAASDVYALAVVLYEQAAGRRPHEHPDPFEELRRSCRERPLSLRVYPAAATLPGDWVRWVDAALALEPADRPSLAELLACSGASRGVSVAR